MLQHTCWWVDPWCFGAGAQQVGVCSLLSSSLLTCRAFPAARAVPPVPGNAFAAMLAWKERKHGQLKAFCSFTVFRSSPFGIAQGYCSVVLFLFFFFLQRSLRDSCEPCPSRAFWDGCQGKLLLPSRCAVVIQELCAVASTVHWTGGRCMPAEGPFSSRVSVEMSWPKFCSLPFLVSVLNSVLKFRCFMQISEE